VLPIGGLKEKLLAAHRGGITTVLIPDDNTKDLAEIPDNIKEKLDIRPVKWIDEVLQVALTHMPTALPAPPDPAKPPEVIAGEKRRRKPARVKSQVRAH
jgi:ATP-dependent Lon protease